MPSRLVAGPIVGQTDSFGATWGNPALLPRLSVQPRPRLNWVPLPQHQAQQQVAGHYQQYQLTPTLTLILTLTLTQTLTLTLSPNPNPNPSPNPNPNPNQARGYLRAALRSAR